MARCQLATTTAALWYPTSASLATSAQGYFSAGWSYRRGFDADAQPGWIHGQSSNAGVSLATVADHIDYICQLAGNSRHAALGTDLDGGFGREQSPHDLDTIADLQKLVGLLAGRGYHDEDIASIMHGNWLRLRRCWSEAGMGKRMTEESDLLPLSRLQSEQKVNSFWLEVNMYGSRMEL
jgi:hypothetical protein